MKSLNSQELQLARADRHAILVVQLTRGTFVDSRGTVEVYDFFVNRHVPTFDSEWIGWRASGRKCAAAV